jgi:hypothetical protein
MRENRIKGERKGDRNQSGEQLSISDTVTTAAVHYLSSTAFLIVLSVRNHGYLFMFVFLFT